MSAGLRFGSRTIRTSTVLLVLLGLSLAGALLTPESGDQGGGASSYSAAAGGTRIMYELAQRMGWRASRREAVLDSVVRRDVQVVIGPSQALGAREVHRLLENVRAGGGLIFTVEDIAELRDSLGILVREGGRFLARDESERCPRPLSFGERRTVALAPSGYAIAWRRPAPGPVTELASGSTTREPQGSPVAVGFPLGAGRVAAVSTTALLTNDALRVCHWGADVLAARALEYVQPRASNDRRIAFDEFHHGHGVHGGSMKAVSMFLSRTASGRFLAQALVAALVLLLAAAPRPIVPEEPARIARRSPLEHADALAHAYADVGATRTATSRLIDGLRRRAGRMVSASRKADDAGFLDAIEQRMPSLAPSVAAVRRGLRESLPVRDFVPVGDAVATIERALLTSPPPKS